MGAIRFILAISVFIAHSGPIFGTTLVGGDIAVESFFILSGFYMTMIITEKYSRKKKFYKNFIFSRFLRIYPLYLITLIASAVIYFLLFLKGSDNNFFFVYLNNFNGKSLLSWTLLLIENVTILGQNFVYIAEINKATATHFISYNFASTNPLLYKFMLNPQSWSLGVELIFYLLIPFLLKMRQKSLILLFVASITIKVFLFSQKLDTDAWQKVFFPSELYLFVAGIFSYKISRHINFVKISMKYTYLSFLVFISFTIFYAKLLATLLDTGILKYIYYFSIFLFTPIFFEKTKTFFLDRYLGDLAYPVYITHFLLINLVAYRMDKSSYFELVSLAITLITSAFLLKYIQKPIDKYRHKIF